MLNAINYALNGADAKEYSNDLLIDEALYKILPKNYKKSLSGIFGSIYEANCWHLNEFTLRTVRRLSKPYEGRIIYPLIFIKNLMVERIADRIYKRSKTAFLRFRITSDFNPLKYNDIFLHNIPPMVQIIFDLLYHKNKLRKVHIFEDGVDSYNTQYQAEYFSNTYKDLEIYTHLYEPDLVVFDNPVSKIALLPKLSRDNADTIKCLNGVYGYEYEDISKRGIEFILLDQYLERCVKNNDKKQKYVYKLKIELYEAAIDILKQKLLFKIHPMSLTQGSRNSYKFENAVIDPKFNRYPLEIVLLNSKQRPGLISISSTASFTPYIAFKDELPEYNLIILDRFFKLGEIDARFSNVERFIDKLGEKHNFYRPSTMAEYKEILHSLG